MRGPRTIRRSGHTLFELVSAGTLIAIAVVTSSTLLRESLELSRETERRNLLTTLGVSKLEEHLAIATKNFANGVFTGTFASDGYDEIRYQVVQSTAASDGGIPDRLMAVTVLVWDDTDGDAAHSAGEPSVELRSKLAKITAWNL